jgi:chromosome segregation ATPase
MRLETQRLEREKERLSSELSEATFRLEELERTYQTNINKTKDVEAKLKTLAAENEKYETEHRTLKEKDREGETSRALLEQKVQQLDARFKTSDSERKELKGKVFGLQDEISDLAFQLESRTSEVGSLDAQVKILSEKYEKNLDENARINGEVGELKLNLESTLRDSAEKDEEIKHLTDTKTRIENEIVSLKETMFSDQDSGQKQPQLQEKLQKELLDAHKAVSELEVRVKKAETGESRIREELRRKIDKVTSLELELDEVRPRDVTGVMSPSAQAHGGVSL